MKRLYKDKEDAMICGVCSGIAKYLNIDPSIVRLGYVLFFILNPAAVFILYIAACIILPEKTSIEQAHVTERMDSKARSATLLFLGIILIILGLILIPSWSWNSIAKLWGIAFDVLKIMLGMSLIIAGVIVLLIVLIGVSKLLK